MRTVKKHRKEQKNVAVGLQKSGDPFDIDACVFYFCIAFVPGAPAFTTSRKTAARTACTAKTNKNT